MAKLPATDDTFSSTHETLASAAGAKKGQKVTKKFIINCSQPVNDKIFDIQAFEKFLHDRIKVEGRTGNLGDVVQISQQGDGKIEVIAHQEFSGRYLKYLYVSVVSQDANCICPRVDVDGMTAPRSSSRSNSSVTGFVSSPPPRVFTSSASSTLSTMRRMKTTSRLYPLCDEMT
ncbi:hypothetical protein IAQ61_005580 [Plenodomus lingam]|uniref:uncharacterized protein n=1 Tax=Leptosphaeria maculans TaxID=5022 RepID=UPI00331712DF|nr:hypothetical protein IAQ61_005580 [Plenodomus lingam]